MKWAFPESNSLDVSRQTTAETKTHSHVRRTSEKWPFNERPLLFKLFSEVETLDRLTHYVASRDTERAEGCPEQHYRGAAVRNTIGASWAKERPPGKAISASCGRNGDAST